MANDDAAAKKSVWLIRRVLPLREAMDPAMGEGEACFVRESNQLADPFTKYLALSVWLRHMAYLLNDTHSW